MTKQQPNIKDYDTMGDFWRATVEFYGRSNAPKPKNFDSIEEYLAVRAKFNDLHPWAENGVVYDED